MQSKNQVVVLGIRKTGTDHPVKPFGRPSWKKETTILLCCCRMDFKLYSLHLQCSGHVPSKNGVDLVRGKYFLYKSDKTSGQTIRPIKKIVPYHERLVLNLYCTFTILWTYPFQNEVASIIGQDELGVKNFGRPR